MAAAPVLYQYRHSLYCWIARLALTEKGVAYETVEVNPFEPGADQAADNPHPFNRVPVLLHEGNTIIETNAICRYIDEAFDGPALQPDSPVDRAAMNQIISIIDAYGYWPMIRQVYSHDVFQPRFDESNDQAEISQGLEKAVPVLDALESLVSGRIFLVSDHLTLADIWLAPVISFFSASSAGADLLKRRPKLSNWYAHFQQRNSFLNTFPE